MRFINEVVPPYDLTYSDVFLVPSLSDVASRTKVDLTPPDMTGATLPIVAANMTAVTGTRMVETIARRGGLAVLPQDAENEKIENTLAYIKSRHTIYDTPITLMPDETIRDALSLIDKRAHGAVIVVDAKDTPVGIFTPSDGQNFDLFTQLSAVMSAGVKSVDPSMSPEEMYRWFDRQNISHLAPVMDKNKLLGVVTKKGTLRNSLYKPALDKKNKLLVAAAIGINGKPHDRAKLLIDLGVDVLVVDTAHGHQTRAINAIKEVRRAIGSKKIQMVAGNVVTAGGTRDLIEAGADIVKVGVGPGAMCTTRMMTGVGRPQFSAVMDCAAMARSLGKHIWADGGVRYPRDVALALAAGASSVMIGSWLAGTYESPGDIKTDGKRIYKESFGMASGRAVENRTRGDMEFERARKRLFNEGISTSRMYIDPERPSAEDIIDQIVAGVRSSFTYAGAQTIEEFHDKAVVGIQSSAGFEEGRPLDTSW